MRALIPRYVGGGNARTAACGVQSMLAPSLLGLRVGPADGSAPFRRWNSNTGPGSDERAPTGSLDSTGEPSAPPKHVANSVTRDSDLLAALERTWLLELEQRKADRAAEVEQRKAELEATLQAWKAGSQQGGAGSQQGGAGSQQGGAGSQQGRADREKWLDRGWNLFSTVVGAGISVATTYVFETQKRKDKADAATKKEEEDAERVAKRAGVIRGQLEAALALLRRARSAYLAHQDPRYSRAYLDQATAAINHAEDWMRLKDLPYAAVMQALLKPKVGNGKVGVDWETCVPNLHACINYHLAALELRGEDGVSERTVLALLGKSLALREAAAALADTPPHKGLVSNELARVTIKWADALSRLSKPLDALHMYTSADIVGRFLVVRATNNRAVVQFGRGDDVAAWASLANVAAMALRWLQHDPGQYRAAPNTQPAAAQSTNGCWWRDAAAVQSAAAVGAALSYEKACDSPLSEEVGRVLLKLIALGYDDALDILHLPALGGGQAASGLTGSPLAMEALTLADLQGTTPDRCNSRQLAVECLERTKLMVRKYYTSRANGLLVAAAPYSTALEGKDATALVALLQELCSDPWAAAPRADEQQPPFSSTGFAVLVALNKAWMEQEGVARLSAALGMGLVALARACPTDTEEHKDMRQRLLRHADALTSRAQSRLKHAARPPLPDVHSCAVAVARARYLETADPAGRAAAWAELQKPALPLTASRSILQWSRERQLHDEILAKKQDTSSLRAPLSASPRHARWQATVLAYALDLQPSPPPDRAVPSHSRGWLGWLFPASSSRASLDSPEPRDASRQALAFAVTPFRDEHPLRKVAAKQAADAQVPLAWTPETDAEAKKLLVAIEQWEADMGTFLRSSTATTKE